MGNFAYNSDGKWLTVRDRADNFPFLSGGTMAYGVPGMQITFSNMNTTFAGGANHVQYFPMFVTRPLTITDAAINVIIAAGATDFFDIYINDADDDFQPISGTARTIATNVDISTTGVKTFTGLSISLLPGMYLSEIFNPAGNAQARTFGGVIPALTDFNHVPDTLPNIEMGVNFAALNTTRHAPWTQFNRFGNAGQGFRSAVLYKWTYQ